MSAAAAPYVRLLGRFLAGEITGAELDREYWRVQQNDETEWGDDYPALDDLCWVMDGFEQDPALRDPGDLDEAQLREHCERILRLLTK